LIADFLIGSKLDVVDGSQKRKCVLKYVIYTPGRHEKSGTEAPQGSLKNEQVSNGRVGYAWWNRRPQEQDRELKKNLS
jgi:hypothetical protein